MLKKYMDTKEAAEILLLSPFTIRKFIRNGKLTASKVGKSFLISEDEIEAFVKRSSTL